MIRFEMRAIPFIPATVSHCDFKFLLSWPLFMFGCCSRLPSKISLYLFEWNTCCTIALPFMFCVYVTVFFHKNWMFWCEPSAGFFCFIYFFWKSEESPFSVKDWLQVNHSCWMLYYTINRTYPSSTWENDLQSRYFSWLE